jgi:tRNA threonylcarbamoyladenosine biosynthesis protein TsaB
MTDIDHQEARRDISQTGRTDTSQEPLILAVETSSRIGSVALALGPRLLSQVSFSAPLRHSMEVFPSITQLLNRFGYRPQDIRQIHIATGPGSFTGLRIAVTMAKAMSLAGGVRIVAVDTLDTIAATVSDRSPMDVADSGVEDPAIERIATLLDAKRGQFFTAAYERIGPDGLQVFFQLDNDPGYRIPAPCGGFWRKILPDCLMSAEQLLQRFAASDPPLCLVGDGLLYHQDAFTADGIRILSERLWSPTAASVHTLAQQKAQSGRFADPLSLVPFYLRGPDVTLKRV